MFEKDEINKAIRIHKQAYQFLNYIGDKIDKNKISFSKAHNDESPSELVNNWILVYYDYLPKSILPPKTEIREFSNYFTSYLSTSFEFMETPEATNIGSGCYCDICLQMANLSHLKSLSPNNHDRMIAKQKQIEILKEVSNNLNVNIAEEYLIEILKEKQVHFHTSMVAYSKALLQRIRNSEGGVYILALWRHIAWDEKNKPKDNFELKAEDIFTSLGFVQKRLVKLNENDSIEC